MGPPKFYGVEASQRPAPFWRRLAAICYDLLLVTALLMALTTGVIMLRGGRAIEPGSVWFQILLVGCWWLYFGWSWTHGGQTIGMRAWRLSLSGEATAAISWRQAGIRFLAAALSAAAFGIGFLWALFDPDRRAWHDRLSQTRLEFRPKSAQPRNGDERYEEQ